MMRALKIMFLKAFCLTFPFVFSHPIFLSGKGNGSDLHLKVLALSHTKGCKWMGTKVQYKTYFPGQYLMRNLNKDTDSWWYWYYGNRTLSGHVYNDFALRPINGYIEYDKERLKQTMLEHEAIFRKQVYELHRLYRIQKGLMDEFQNEGLYRSSVPVDILQSNSFSSQMPSEGIKKIWRMTHLPMLSTSYNMVPVAGTDGMKPPLHFFKESSAQSDQYLVENKTPQKESDSQESKLERFPRRKFDLQLPADVYIDSEDVDREGKENVVDSSFRYSLLSDKIYATDPGNDMKLTLGTGVDLSQQEDWKVDSLKHNGLPAHGLTALNESVGQILCEVSAGPVSTDLFCPRTRHEEDQVHQLPMRSETNFLGLQGALSEDRHSNEGSCSHFPYADKEETRWEWPLSNDKSGVSRISVSSFSSGFHNEEVPMSLQLKATKSHEISGKSPGLVNSNKSELATPVMSGSFSVAANLNYNCIGSPLVSALAKPVNSITHIAQALPCFNGSEPINAQSKTPNAIHGFTNTCDIWLHDGDLKPYLRLGSEGSPYPNGFHHHSQLNSNYLLFDKLNLNSKVDHSASGNDEDRRTQKNLRGLHCTNVNSATEVNLNRAHLNAIGDNLLAQHDIGISAVEGKCHASSGEISWLTKKASCNESVDLNKDASEMNFGFSQGYHHLISSSRAVGPELERRQEKGNDLSICNFQGSHSTSEADKRVQRNEANDKMNRKKILGFHVDEIQQNAICSPSHQERSVTDDKQGRENDGLCYSKSLSGIEAPSLEKQISVGGLIQRGSTYFRSCINLNSTISDNPYSTEMLPEGEMEASSPHVMPCVSVKVAFGIDLEASVASQMEKNTLPQEESMPSSKADGSQETQCSHEALARKAAQNIVSMLANCSSVDLTSGQSSPVPCDTLKWFAEVVSSTKCATMLRERDGCSDPSDDGLDHFELMTLKLEETKVDENWCRPREPQNQKEDVQSSALLLLLRPRRGQARRRQRRDFQKDILPRLASLSKREVTEDLQTIGVLQTGLTRRNTARNGLQSRARGRRGPRSLSVTMAEIQVSPPHPQSTKAEVDIDGRTMRGWERRTRRCQRQRCPPVNVSAPLV